MMRFLVFVAALVVTVDAWACSCWAELPIEKQLETAELVFVGEVTDVDDRYHVFRKVWTFLRELFGRDPFGDDPEAFYGYSYAFKVERSWRGPGTHTVRVITGRGGGDCGYPFERGERYLVYGQRADDGTWRTGICTRTQPAADAAIDIAFLNAMP